MIVYPMRIEPHEDMFIAVYPDIPELTECIGDERYDAILIGVERLGWVLTDLYLEGRQMPRHSPVEAGQIGVPAPFHWSFT